LWDIISTILWQGQLALVQYAKMQVVARSIWVSQIIFQYVSQQALNDVSKSFRGLTDLYLNNHAKVGVVRR
jgi:hypothetical protein